MSDWTTAVSTDLYALIQKPRLGLLVDIDGTLSHIAATPQDAVVTEKNKKLLGKLVKHLDVVAAITGRAAADAQRMIGVPGLLYIGNHGMERLQDDKVEILPEVRRFRPRIDEVMGRLQGMHLPGVIIEDKYVSLSVHYRLAEDPELMGETLRSTIKSLCYKHSLSFHEGRMVFEVRPSISLDKGTALETLAREYDLHGLVFIGDDTTDVDAMRAAHRLRESTECYAISLGVDSPETPDAVRQNADLMIDQGVEGVEEFLSWLLRARKASSS